MFCNSNYGFYLTSQALNVLLDLAAPRQSGSDRYSRNGANFEQDLRSPVEQIENVRKIFPLFEKPSAFNHADKYAYYVLYNLHSSF